MILVQLMRAVMWLVDCLIIDEMKKSMKSFGGTLFTKEANGQLCLNIWRTIQYSNKTQERPMKHYAFCKSIFARLRKKYWSDLSSMSEIHKRHSGESIIRRAVFASDVSAALKANKGWIDNE